MDIDLIHDDDSRVLKAVSGLLSYEQCPLACEQTSRCVAWTWDPVRLTCYLTDRPGDGVKYLEYISGVSTCVNCTFPHLFFFPPFKQDNSACEKLPHLPSSSTPFACVALVCWPSSLLLNVSTLRWHSRQRCFLHLWCR